MVIEIHHYTNAKSGGFFGPTSKNFRGQANGNVRYLKKFRGKGLGLRCLRKCHRSFSFAVLTFTVFIVADPDPGSDAFFDPGSGDG
jgi:hypothetical protein